LFLSANCDLEISLTILSNLAAHDIEIPQLSLIISCLMQDLHENIAQRTRILYTLVGLVSRGVENVQERDLKNSILPFLSPKQRPEIVFLAIQIFERCDGSVLLRFFNLIVQNVFEVLNNENMQIPVLIEACLEFIASLGQEFDLREFFTKTGLMSYIDEVVGLLGGEGGDVSEVVEHIVSIKDAIQAIITRGEGGGESGNFRAKLSGAISLS
jgi:hypothetical protein